MTSTRGALLMSSALLGVGFALAAAPLSAAAASTTPRALPTIGTFAANRHTLPSTGGVVLLRVRTQNATQCRLTFENPHRVGTVFQQPASICNGTYRVTVWANHASAAVPVVFRFEAREGSHDVFRAVSLREVAPLPTIGTFAANRHTLPSTGGVVLLRVRTQNATQCRLTFENPQHVGAIFRRSASICNGSYRIIVGQNTASVAVPVVFRYEARAGGRSVSRVLNLSEAPHVPTTSTTPGTSTSTTPGTSTSTTPGTSTSPPPSAPTASLLISANTIPSGGGSFVLTYAATNASSCTLSSSPALWKGSDPASVSCDGTSNGTLGASTTGGSWTFTFTAASTNGQTVSASQTLSEQGSSGTITPSSNWAGYVVPSTTQLITEASGEWTVPVLNCAVTPSASVWTWVGIGGASSPTGGSSGVLLQTGVGSQCVAGAQQNQGWWEEYPSSPNQAINFSSFPVAPGDVMKGEVFQTTSGAWETLLDDTTTGLMGVMVTGQGWGIGPDSGSTYSVQGSTSGLSYSGGYSAEWIVEDPSISGQQPPLADFGTVTFTNLGTSLSSWSLPADEAYEIVQNGAVLATAGAPQADGFSVTYAS